MPICMAKTQYSLSDDQFKLGAPTGFKITVRELRISAGAGFIVALTGNILTMPGLPKNLLLKIWISILTEKLLAYSNFLC